MAKNKNTPWAILVIIFAMIQTQTHFSHPAVDVV